MAYGGVQYPGVIVYACFSAQRKEKTGFFEHNTLVLQVSGQFTLETAYDKISMKAGEMLLKKRFGKAPTAWGY